MAQRPLPNDVRLREVIDDDLLIFFTQQQDPTAIYMAAFTAKDPTDKDAFLAHWARITHDDTITIRTILFEGQVAGYVLCHPDFGEPEISYWLGQTYWGQGIATRALDAFLDEYQIRPLTACAAHDNQASIRVLQKCNFVISGTDRGFANARGQEIDEVILRLG